MIDLPRASQSPSGPARGPERGRRVEVLDPDEPEALADPSRRFLRKPAPALVSGPS